MVRLAVRLGRFAAMARRSILLGREIGPFRILFQWPDHISDDLGDISLDVVLIGILPMCKLALDIHQLAFLEVAFDAFGQLSPDDNVMPFSLGLPFAVLVLVRFIGRYRKLGDDSSVIQAAYFRVTPQVTNEGHFVDHDDVRSTGR